MEKITISAQLEPDLYEALTSNVKEADRSLADYLRLIIKSELKNKTVLKAIKKIG
jgi:hypothetical protein